MSQFQVTGFAIVTGGGGGIGKEVGLTFAEAGARGVLFADVKHELVIEAAELSKKVATCLEYQAFAVKLDVTDAQSIQEMVDLAVQNFGRIDYLINAAGVSQKYGHVVDVDQETFDHVMDVNAKGAYMVSQAVIKIMRDQEQLSASLGRRHGVRELGRGCIVNVASAQSNAAIAGQSAYVASKHALLGITRACAVECRPYCIRVNQLAPTWVRTPMYEWACAKAPSLPAIIEKIVPNGRPAEPDEVAAAALYLCSPSGGYVSGLNLVIDYSLGAGPPAF